MNDFDADQVQDQTIRDLNKIIEQQSELIKQQLVLIEYEADLSAFLRRRDHALIDVLEEYRQSRWWWVRQVAEKMYSEMHKRTIAQIGRETKKTV